MNLERYESGLIGRPGSAGQTGSNTGVTTRSNARSLSPSRARSAWPSLDTIEAGTANFTATTLARICAGFGLDVADVFSRKIPASVAAKSPAR
jgi:hypothetical protein